MSFLKDRLDELVSAERHKPGKHRARIIAVTSQKGGVGKTTTAVNLGTALAHYLKKKTLVVDLDPQGHVEKSLGQLIPEGIEYNPLSTLLVEKNADILDAVVRTDQDRFYLTPGDKYLVETENLMATKIGKEFLIQKSLRNARTHFDYIVFDCPPAMGNLTVNALTAAHKVIIPCEMSVLAFEGVSDFLDTLGLVNENLNPDLDVLGVLFTRVDNRNSQMNELVMENMKKYFKGRIFKTQIAINTALNKAQLEGRPVFEFSPRSTGSQNYEKLAREVEKRWS